MKPTTTIFKLTEAKKHSVRYDYDGPVDGSTPIVATSVYVSKTSLSQPYPPRIKLTVEEA